MNILPAGWPPSIPGNTRRRSIATRYTIAAFALTVAACAPEPATLELRGNAMGTGYSIRIVAPNSGSTLPLDPLRDRIAAHLEDLEDRFSTYRQDSEVSRFNAYPGQDWFSVSPVFLEVLRQGIAISQLSDGAFDMTVGPLVELRGFAAGDRTGLIPPRHAIEALLAATGFAYLEMRDTPPAVRRTRPGVQLDLSGIAKGYAVDELSRLLGEAGFSAYMVEIGGEVRSRGHRADGEDWAVGIEDPDGAGTTATVPLRDAAIATSGDYRNYFEYEGQRYSHTLDPRTARPITHSLASVSVISSTAATADALATALLVMGPAAGLELAVRENIAARLVLRTADGLQVLHTPAYEAGFGDRG